MMARENEWSLPLVRFFGALFVPPLCSGLLISALTVLTRGFEPALFATFLSSFMISVVPSIFWFVAMESLYERRESIRSSRIRFTLMGASLGAIFTMALYLVILTISGAWKDLISILNPS